jgi:ligand-binding SRPBCC domain-containing protein
VVYQKYDHKRLRLHSRFIRYLFASIFLALRAAGAISCGKADSKRLVTQLQFDDWVPLLLPRVFAFFSNPENLPRIMPTATQTRIDRLHLVAPTPSPHSSAAPQAAGVGTVIETSFLVFPFLPFRAQWIARITGFEWNYYFADIQQKGPFKRWHHRHEFLAETRNGLNGTVVRDLVDYEIGFGALGAIANSIFVERQMRNMFAQRQKILPDLLSRE